MSTIISVRSIHSFFNSARSLAIFLLIILSISQVSAQEPYDILTKFTGSDQFGETVAIDGEFAFVGAPALSTPAVYVFHFNGSYWEEVQILNGPANGAFGASLDLDGDYAIIGDRLDDESGSNAGCAYIYKYDGVSWTQVKKIIPDDAAPGNFFGWKVAIHDDIAGISAQYDYNNNNNNNDFRFQGSAYILQRDAGSTDNWGQVEKFKSNDISNERQDEFGRTLDVTADYLLVGSNNNDSGVDQNGSAYIFYRNQNGSDQWGLQSILQPLTVGPEGGNFGISVAMDGDVIVVGDNSTRQEDDQGNQFGGSISIFRRNGAQWNFETRIFQAKLGAFAIDKNDIVLAQSDIYIYKFAEGQWSEKTIIQNSSEFNVSGDIALSGVTLVAGHPDYLNLTGAAYFFEFIATPNEVTATDGKYLNRIVVKWNNRSDRADGFRVYRDGEEIGSALSVATTYNDYDAIPGKIQTYQVSAYNNTWNESALSQSDLGWMQARGEIQGTVQTDQGAAINDVEITITDKFATVGTYLSFDGIDDYVQLPYTPRTRQMTVSAWIRSAASTDQQIIGWGSAVEASSIEFKLVPDGKLAYAEWNGTDWNPVVSDHSVNDGAWHFVCVVIDNDSCFLFIDGNLDKTGSGFTRDITVTTTSIGAYDRVFAVQQFFHGDIDDVRMWERARTEDEIQFDMLNSLEGEETGLIGYWTFDDSTRSGANIAADYRHGSGHHGMIIGANWQNGERSALKQTFTNADGEYKINNFYFENKKEFRVTPNKEKHLFDPEYTDMVLEGGLGGSAGFTDTTSFTVSGQILFAGTSCGVKGVELLLNDKTTGVYTDAAGKFALAIEEPGLEYTITPVLGDSSFAHKFEPAEITMIVEDNIDGLHFGDVEKQLLYGKVRGGCIAGLGIAQIRVSSINDPACYGKTIVTDFNGNFRTFLPAQEYLVELIAIDHPDSLDILNFFAAEKVDLRFENQNVLFFYHPPPIIQLTVFPDQRTCDANPVPIMEQSIRYDVLIEVLESYSLDTCYVTSGEVTIYDDIGGNPAEPVVIPIQNGKSHYTLVPDVPNILGGGEHPYQKLLQIKADVAGRTGSLDQWVLVTGKRPRTQTFFSAATPELPLMILRDPPGDQSYSFLTKGSTYTTNFSQTLDTSATDGAFLDLNLGIISGIGWTIPFVGAHAESDFGGYGKFAINTFRGEGTEYSNGSLISLSMNEEFRTSESEDVPSAESDVFIGASINQTFFLADIIDYDPSTCQIVKDTSLAFTNDGFNSTYVYTEDHIRNTLIPQLEELRNLSGPDSLFDYDQAISVWRQVLNHNDSLKLAAQFMQLDGDIPNPEYLLENNISFSGGTSTTQYSVIQTETFNTITYKQIFSRDKLAGVGVVLAGVTTEFGWQWNLQSVRDTTFDTTYTNINTIGYTLADDDAGDFFSVDVLHDPSYGTPVFNLVAGTSSCPWEPGTQPRDGVQLGIDTFVQNDVSPDEPATFSLILGNTSESGESRPYDLRLIQLSNPDGAIIKVGGVPMGDALSYYIPAGDSAYQATLTVERGPRAYDYDNLQLMMVPPCEFDLYNSSTAFADTVTFSVHFASPLSDAGLTYPQDNWQVDPADPDSLPVVINNYNIRNDYLKSIKLQYRKPDGSWNTAFDVAKNQLPDQNLTRYWNYQNLTDGDYELRVVSDGGANGVRYSPVAKGRIGRNALLVVGEPEPADKVLNIGESIAISFAAGIDLDKLNIQRDISLLDAADSTTIDFNIVVQGNQLIIQPDLSFTELAERTLIANVSNITDADGNRLRQPVSWRFRVNQQTAYLKSFSADIRTYQGNEEINTAVLYNAGSTDAAYQIVYLPDWLLLSSDERSGTLAPGAEKLLAFKSGHNIPQGTVHDSLVLVIAGQKDSRPLTLNVLSAPPQWGGQQPSGGAYMTQIYTQLLLNQHLSDDKLDFAGVFINDQLSGLGHIRLDEVTGKYLAAFPVYYQAPVGGTLEFRLWDASEGTEYRYYSDDLIFQNGKVLGSRYNPLIIEPNEIFQTISLANDWNWISFNVAPSDLSPGRVLKDYSAEPGDIIKGQFGFSEYSQESGWTGTLDFMRPEFGYRLRSHNNSNLITSGRQANSFVTPASLTAGWNWIGYLPEKPLMLRDALYFMQAVPGDMIKSQNKSAIYNNNGEWLGTLHEMQPGESYLLLTQASTALVYPDLKKLHDYQEKADWSVDIYNYESNMTLISAFNFDGADYGDSSLIVAAFVNGQCRGVARPQYVPHLGRFVTFLMIYADPAENGDSVLVQVYDPKHQLTRDVAEVMVFNTDGHFGSVQEPMELNALQTERERIPAEYYLQQNYPNPFNPLTTIEYGLPVDVDVTIAIYNILGQKVSVLVDKQQPAGKYKIQFDAAKLGMASGIYFYQIHTNAFIKSHKMLLLK